MSEFTIEQIREFVKKDYQSVAARFVKSALQIIDGSDREMGEFAEWIAYKSYSMGNIGHWDKTWHIDDGEEFTGTEKVYTTSELLKLFRQSKTDKPNPQP